MTNVSRQSVLGANDRVRMGVIVDRIKTAGNSKSP